MTFACFITFVLALTLNVGKAISANYIRGRDLLLLEQENELDGEQSSFPSTFGTDEEEQIVLAAESSPQEEPPPTTTIVSDVETSMIDQDLTSPSTSSNTKSYIITFNDDVTTPIDKLCAEKAKEVGGTVDFVYSCILKGCVLTVPLAPQEDLAMQQAQDIFTTLIDSPEVITVEEDQITSIDPFVPDQKIQPDQFAPTTDVSFLMPQVKDCAHSTATSWGLDRINQCRSCDGMTTKQDADGVKVFIMDTGIRGDHLEFNNIIDPNDECHFSAFADSGPMEDYFGHG